MTYNIYRIIAFSLTIVLMGCKENKTQTDEDTSGRSGVNTNELIVSQKQFDQNKMELGTLTEQPFPEIVEVNGMIDVPPENRAVVTTPMGGYIKSAPLLVGDKVNKGQQLVTIENPEFVSIQQEYMEIHEQLTYLKSEYDRQVTMRAENITSQKSFLKSESEYKTALAKYAGLEKQLQMLNISPSRVRGGDINSVVSIFAPISGSVTKVNVTKGSFVSPANEILEIIDNDHIHLELSVFEKDIMKIKKGQDIKFKIPESSTKTFDAAVYLVGTSIGPNRTIQVHGHLENDSENNFLTGMFVEAQIITDDQTSSALPSEAIVTINDEHYVLILDKKDGANYYFKQERVLVNENYGAFSIVKSELEFEPNTQFLTKGAFSLIAE